MADMEDMDMKSGQVICLENDVNAVIELETVRKVLLSLLDFRAYISKVAETNEKIRLDIEGLEMSFVEAVGRHEPQLQRYLAGDWSGDEYAQVEQYIDTSQLEDGQFVVEGDQLISDSVPYTMAEKKDVMAIAAAEVVTHSYRDGLYICGWDGCEYQTSSRRHINNHKLVHTGDSEYSCSFGECGKRFKTQAELEAHSEIHNNDEPYPCVWPNCGYRSSTPASLKAHMKVHMEKKYSCPVVNCPKEFTKPHERDEHARVHSYDTSASESPAPSTSGQQQQQSATVSGNVNAAGQQVTLVSTVGGQPVQIIANTSNGQLASGQQITLVQMAQPPQTQPATAQKTSHSQQQQQQSTERVTVQVTPTTGSQSGSSANTSASGNASQAIATASIMGGSLFKCNNENCNAYFSTVYDLKQHQPTHSKSEKPWKCDHENCEYSAYSKTALSEHKITHTSERKYTCPFPGCDRKYKTRKGLWDHQQTHRNDKPFACSVPDCSYKAVSSSYLRSHMRSHKDHTQQLKDGNLVMVTSMPAQNGGTPSTGSGSMIQVAKGGSSVQMVNASPAAPQQQQFFAPGTIIQHPNGRQEFFCGILGCGQSFDNQNLYLNHVKTHAPVNNITSTPIQTITTPAVQAQTPSTPKVPKNRSRNPDLAKFKCEFEGCTSAYKLRRNLKDHMIRHTILEKPYRCDWPGCDYGSYKSTNVAKHKSVHSDERRFGCQYFNCTKRFKTREGLRKHMLSHHKVNRADIP